ncbi:hypothetical protein B0H66DRAFT_547248 [Apodospora peruviana]|uniref:Uncharacterized protein n=1 Tax=Apodospora peruviana TaxID=516989 RepID=A0AAE0IHW6_9PEZI|nr:hypothetical protein B0H66DRAFT_547248 [Apodospora peruviana]
MDVLPIAPTDLFTPVPNIRTRTFFIVDDRLDQDALRNGLDTLIRDHWRKLGARLVGLPKKGKLVYHLPKEFAPDYELFRWSVEKNDHSIDKVASSLLKPDLSSANDTNSESEKPSQKKQENGGVRMMPSTDRVDSWFRPKDWPLEVKDDVGAPLLFVHLTLFTDASVLTLSTPHVLCDQLGTAVLVKAWIGVVDGKAPPPMVGFDEDVLPGKKPFKEYPKSKTREKGKMKIKRKGERFVIVLSFIPELVMHPKEEAAMLLFPAALVDAIRERHSKSATTGEKAETIKLTNADFLTAVLTKLSRFGKTSKPMLALSQTINLRGRIPELAEESKWRGFLHNSLVYATAHFRYYPAIPLGDIARLNREAITGALEKDEVDVRLAVTREMVRRKQGILICEPFEKLLSISNWTPAWRGLDFTPALMVSAKEARGEKPLKLMVIGRGGEASGPGRYLARIMCKTEEGYWCDFRAATKVFEKVKEYLAQDPMLENL